ncbi:rhodanese-like domain-containing protein [Schaalia canis]|nr:rhodanese-like domain-containing protein [Schaalia canis]
MMSRRRPALAALCGACLIVLSACASTPADSAAEVNTESSSTASTQNVAPSDMTIIDVRTPEEYAEGHLEGAVNIDIQAEDFKEQIAALDPAGNYAVYCRSGNRSGQAVSFMESAGFTSVQNLGSRDEASEILSTPIVK